MHFIVVFPVASHCSFCLILLSFANLTYKKRKRKEKMMLMVMMMAIHVNRSIGCTVFEMATMKPPW